MEPTKQQANNFARKLLSKTAKLITRTKKQASETRKAASNKKSGQENQSNQKRKGKAAADSEAATSKSQNNWALVELEAKLKALETQNASLSKQHELAKGNISGLESMLKQRDEEGIEAMKGKEKL